MKLNGFWQTDQLFPNHTAQHTAVHQSTTLTSLTSGPLAPSSPTLTGPQGSVGGVCGLDHRSGIPVGNEPE